MINKRIDLIKKILEEKNADNVEIFDTKDSDYFVDTVIIASSIVSRHNSALLDALQKALKGKEEFINIETSDDWIVADLADVLVHIMTKNARQTYDLEKFLINYTKDRR